MGRLGTGYNFFDSERMASETPEQTLDDAEQTYCYGHPDVPTKLRCSR